MTALCAILSCFLPAGGSIVDKHWSGYAWTARAGTYAQATASFTVPRAECTRDSPALLAFVLDTALWVGFDGYDNQTVEQTGINLICDPWGYAGYFAWWELWPAPPQFVASAPVVPGERLELAVTYRAGTFTFRNSGWVVSRRARRARASAEVIVEAANGPPVPMAPVTFTAGPEPGRRHRITMHNPDSGTMTPSSIAGGRFTLTWGPGA